MNHGFAEVFLNAIVFGLGLTGVAWLLLRDQPRLSAATRLVIWQILFAVVVLLPVLQLVPWKPVVEPVVSRQAAVPVAAEPESAGEAPAGPAPLVEIHDTDVDGTLAFVAVLLAAVQLLRLPVGYWMIWRMKRRGKVLDMALPQGLQREARVLVSETVRAPLAVGFRHPAIVLPKRLVEKLSAEELEQVVLHEAAHLERRDDWWGLLERVLRAVFAVQPALYLIAKNIEREREFACDDWVVEQAGAVRPYAQALARVAELSATGSAPLLGVGVGRRKQIFARMEALLDETRNRWTGVSPLAVLVAGLVVVFLVVEGGPVARVFGSGGYTKNMVVDDGKTRREFRQRGEIVFAADDRGVEWMGAGAKLRVDRAEGWNARTVEMEGDRQGGIRKAYFVGGVKAEYGPEAERWLERELPQWLKEQDSHLEKRLERWFQQDGMEGVLKEIEGVINAEVQRDYLLELSRKGPWTAGQMRRVLAMVAARGNDATRARLVDAFEEMALRLGVESSLVDVAVGIHDGGERAALLERVARRAQPQSVPRLLRAVESVYEQGRKADLLAVLVGRTAGPLPQSFFHEVERIGDDAERRALLVAAVALSGADEGNLRRAIELARRLPKEKQRKAVAEGVLSRPGLSDAVVVAAQAL